jgi:uncharacterized protein YejL (UPF0352 family)
VPSFDIFLNDDIQSQREVIPHSFARKTKASVDDQEKKD